MGYYYKFYRPDNFKLIDEGKFAGMPFYWNDLPVDIKMVGVIDGLNSPYDTTGLMSRAEAIELQKHMTTNETLFTDMMDEERIDALLFRIEQENKIYVE